MMFIVKQSNTAFYYYHVCVEYIIEILHTFYSRICYDAVRDDFGSHRASRTTHWENRVQNGGKTKISYVCLIGNTFAICLHSIRPFWSMPNTKHADWCGCMSKCFSNYLWVRRNWDSFFFLKRWTDIDSHQHVWRNVWSLLRCLLNMCGVWMNAEFEEGNQKKKGRPWNFPLFDIMLGSLWFLASTRLFRASNAHCTHQLIK